MLPKFEGVDAIEIVDLREVDVVDVADFMRNATTAPVVRVEGEQAMRIHALWTALPPAMQMRCHVPPFGLRFYRGPQLLGEASICWRCNNIFGTAGGEEFHYQFSAGARASQELLAIARELTNSGADG